MIYEPAITLHYINESNGESWVHLTESNQDHFENSSRSGMSKLKPSLGTDGQVQDARKKFETAAATTDTKAEASTENGTWSKIKDKVFCVRKKKDKGNSDPGLDSNETSPKGIVQPKGCQNTEICKANRKRSMLYSKWVKCTCDQATTQKFDGVSGNNANSTNQNIMAEGENTECTSDRLPPPLQQKQTTQQEAERQNVNLTVHTSNQNLVDTKDEEVGDKAIKLVNEGLQEIKTEQKTETTCVSNSFLGKHETSQKLELKPEDSRSLPSNTVPVPQDVARQDGQEPADMKGKEKDGEGFVTTKHAPEVVKPESELEQNNSDSRSSQVNGLTTQGEGSVMMEQDPEAVQTRSEVEQNLDSISSRETIIEFFVCSTNSFDTSAENLASTNTINSYENNISRDKLSVGDVELSNPNSEQASERTITKVLEEAKKCLEINQRLLNSQPLEENNPTEPIYIPPTQVFVGIRKSEDSIHNRPPPERKVLATRITNDLDERLEKFHKKLFAVFFTPPGPFTDVEDNTWKWEDPLFVRVPLSSEFNKGEDIPEAYVEIKDKHWEVIRMELEKLLQDLTNANLQLDIGDRLRQAIVAYCPDAEMKSDFEILYRADLHEPLQNTLHLIIQYALCLPYLLSSPIPVLARGQSSTLYLTKRLTCSLLANAFLCTIPDPQEDMPDFNFLRFFSSSSDAKSEVKAEKLKCIINYFSKMSIHMEAAFNGGEEDDDIVSFERRCVQQQRDWKASDRSLIDVHIEPDKGIEEGENMLQVDFANKIVGGGVLNDGAVMEEIRFCICPELIVSRLFTAPLNDDEVLVITGTQQYSLYSGYSTTFKYCGSFGERKEGRDNFGRRFTQVVAMDALHFRQSEISKQFQEPSINRELHKCYVASIHSARSNTPFATGNWGCGVFNGDPEMKFFIQWLSASEAGRQSLYYHTIGDKVQAESIEGIVSYIKRSKLNVSSLYNLLLDYYEDWDDYDSVFTFVKDKLKSLSKGNRSSYVSGGGEVYIKVKTLS